MCDSSQNIESGIYKILNKIDGKFYIGSAKNFKTRWRNHQWYLNNNQHSNMYLQRAWNKYRKENFIFEILEYVQNLNELEQVEQKYLNTSDQNIIYNICKVAGTKLNVAMTQETKDKISNSLKGHTAGMTGLDHSDETRWLMSAVQKGITNRNFEKWPCSDGYYCKCMQCKAKRNGQLLKQKYLREFKKSQCNT
jgi:group I intron endonuclease